jgi:hypothetical protein
MADKKFADFVYDLMDAIPKVNGNPMMSVTSMTDENARYREDPFYKSRDAQERKRLAEEEAAKQAAQSGSGLFGAMPEGGGVDGGGRNYWADREAELGKTMPPDAVRAQILSEQVQSRAAIPAQLLELLMPGMTAIKGIQSLFNPTPTNYATPWAQMTPAEKMYAANNQAPVSDSMIADAMRNDAIQNAIAAKALQQQGVGIDAFGGTGGDSGGYTGNTDVSKSGWGGYGSEVGYG